MICFPKACRHLNLTDELFKTAGFDHHLAVYGDCLHYLHAVNRHSKYLSVVSSSAEFLNFARLITTLVEACNNLRHFIALITQRDTPYDCLATRKLSGHIDVMPALHANLNSDMLRAWETYIQPLEFNEKGVAQNGEFTVHVFGTADAINSKSDYFWNIGHGAFGSDARICNLRDQLKMVPKSFIISRDIATLPTYAPRYPVILLSQVN